MVLEHFYYNRGHKLLIASQTHVKCGQFITYLCLILINLAIRYLLDTQNKENHGNKVVIATHFVFKVTNDHVYLFQRGHKLLIETQVLY